MANNNTVNRSPMNITLYGTSACHLCEQAAAMLIHLRNDYDLNLVEIDICDSESLLAEYSLTIPVLLREDTQEKLWWPFSGEDILKLISRE